MTDEAPRTPFSLLDYMAGAHDPHATTILGWRPRNDNIVVLPLAEIDRTASGIVLPEEYRDRPQKGVVLAIGEGLFDPERQRFVPVETRVGDLIAFGKYAGSAFDLDGITVLIMRDVEHMARKVWGSYALVEHRLGEGTRADRHAYHEAGQLCEHCPAQVSALIEAERAKLIQQFAKELGTDVETTDEVRSAAPNIIEEERQRLRAAREAEETDAPTGVAQE